MQSPPICQLSRFVLASATAVLIVVGCHSGERSDQGSTGGVIAGSGAKPAGDASSDAASAKVQYGWYRGMLQLKGEHRVPFLLRLPAPGSADKALIANGDRQNVVQVEWADDGVKIRPDSDPYPSEITARITTPRLLTGTWHRFNPFWGSLDIPFTAEYLGEQNAAARFPLVAESSASQLPSFAGTWRLELEVRGHAIAELHQTGDGVVTGYIRPERYGDSQSLAGNVRGDRLLLSMFDGRSGATSIIAHLGPDGRLEGTLDIADKFEEKFTGKRDDSYKLDHTITLKPGVKRLPLPALQTATYTGKPVIVILFATWCPVCAEVNAAVLDLYQHYHPQGLEVLGIAIDLSEDEKENDLHLGLYRKKWNIQWETQEVPGSPEDFASISPLSSIKGFEALPVTVFLNPDHSVHAMYAGFDGIATGAKHPAQLEEFKRATEAILKKP